MGGCEEGCWISESITIYRDYCWRSSICRFSFILPANFARHGSGYAVGTCHVRSEAAQWLYQCSGCGYHCHKQGLSLSRRSNIVSPRYVSPNGAQSTSNPDERSTPSKCPTSCLGIVVIFATIPSYSYEEKPNLLKFYGCMAPTSLCSFRYASCAGWSSGKTMKVARNLARRKQAMMQGLRIGLQELHNITDYW